MKIIMSNQNQTHNHDGGSPGSIVGDTSNGGPIQLVLWSLSAIDVVSDPVEVIIDDIGDQVGTRDFLSDESMYNPSDPIAGSGSPDFGLYESDDALHPDFMELAGYIQAEGDAQWLPPPPPDRANVEDAPTRAYRTNMGDSIRQPSGRMPEYFE